MWVFTEIGFFSIVRADPRADGTELVMVRGRDRGDLERLRARLRSEVERELEIFEWTGRDYPYRIIIDRSLWADVVSEFAHEIEYPNFKERIADVAGHERAHVYGGVWQVLLEIERDGAENF